MLAPEVGSAKATLSAFATATKAVSGYCIDLTNANLGPFDIGGTQVNVLSNWPAVQTNIAAARRHATTFLNQNTMIMTLVGVLDFNSAFQKSSGEIVGALNGNGGQQQIAMALQSLLAALQTRAQAVLATETTMKTFNSQLTADESNLNSGEQPISQAIQDVNNWVITEGEAVEG